MRASPGWRSARSARSSARRMSSRTKCVTTWNVAIPTLRDAVAVRALAEHLPRGRSLSEALELNRSKIAIVEKASDERAVARGDDNCIWLSNPLQACREIRGAPERCLVPEARPSQSNRRPPQGRSQSPREPGGGIGGGHALRNRLRPTRTARSASSSWACG
jgi:hypothetical protein